MGNLAFYIKYAWRSILRGGQRSFFAILCIAVGVASIVALQSTGQSIQDTVAGDARADARADVRVTTRQDLFTAEELARFDDLKANKTIKDYTAPVTSQGMKVLKPDGSNSNSFGSFYLSFVVDPAKYPFYGSDKIIFENPKGKTLKDVLTKPGQIVLNSKMANGLGAKVGDKITKAAGDTPAQPLEVVGVLSENATVPERGQADFTGYNYISPDTAKQVYKPDTLLSSDIYVQTDSNTAADNKARDAINALSPAYDAKTSTERNEQLKQGTKGLSDLLSYVGLLSLLIGSVGVVNTMLVVVGRRSSEIATIKALGMESGQTVQVFIVEAAILGVMGSIAGIVLGELLTLAIGGVAGSFISQKLSFQIYGQPILIGLVVGIVTAIVFGLLPAYSASRIPPAQVLRQKTNALPRISFVATLLIILLMTVVMGLLAGVVLGGQFSLGVIIAFGALVSCAILILINAGTIWAVEKLPLPFGLNYKMARRNLGRSRGKNATTMLVMMVGIFAVALVFILSSSLKETIQDALERSFGYNVELRPKDNAQTQLALKAFEDKQVPGLQKNLLTTTANARLVSGGGVSADELLIRKIQKDKDKANSNANQRGGGGGADISSIGGIDAKDITTFTKTTSGRYFANDDEAVISEAYNKDYDIKIGDKLVYQVLSDKKEFSVTVVGIVTNKSAIVNLEPVQVTNNRMASITGHTSSLLLTIDKAQITPAVKYLQTNFEGAGVTDLSFISNIINDLIGNITAFPVLLAFLCLIAGAVLIANNVALAVLERRTEMGVMKSIGADRGRVLSIINWESGIVAFLGGLVGLFLAIGIASALVGFIGTPDNPAVLSVSPVLSIGMLVLAVGLALFATIGSAWGAAQEKPLVVLRYE